MDWNLIWAALSAATGVAMIGAGLFNFVRKNDMKAIEIKFAELEQRIIRAEVSTDGKLSEAEFRRFEERYERALDNLQRNTNQGLEKLETKLDEKFDKLFSMLLEK